MKRFLLSLFLALLLSTPALADLTLTPGDGIDMSSAGAGLDVTVTCETATSVNAGCASFDETDFVVTAGDVALSATPTATTFTGNLSGNAGTASALAANGGNCAAGQSPLGVDAAGAAESCFDVWTEAENTAAAYTSTPDEVGTLTTGDLCTNDGSDVQCTVNTEAELETALDGINVLLETEIDASSELYTLMDDETGSGAGALAVFNANPTLTGATLAGILADNDDMVFECDANNDGSNKYSFTDGASAEVASITEAGLLTVAAGVNLGTSQALLGTTAITIGDNNQTVAINSSDWDIDATGIATGMGNITSDGTITASTSVIAPLFDAAGAEDMDYGSADVTDHTFTADGGVLIIDGSIQFPSADGSPAATGEVQYDNTIAGMAGGGIRWYDNDSVRLLVDLETDPSDDDYVVAYDADADGFYMKLDATGAGGGDVTDVGDCADGACLDGSDDGGTYIRIYDGDSHYLEINPGDLTDNRTLATRDAGGTILISGDTLTGDVTATFDTDGSTATAIAEDTIGTAEMADADHGDVAWSGGAASVEALTINDATTGTYYPSLSASDTGVNQPLYTDGALSFVQATGTLAATEFSGGGSGLTSVDAATGDSATDFFDAGTIDEARLDLTLTVTALNSSGVTTTLGTVAGAIDAGAATSLEIPNGTADVALSAAGQIHLNETDEQLSIHSGSNGEISGEASISLLRHLTAVFDPDAICDGAVDRVFLMTIGDDAPEGIIIDEWKVSFEADPDTEADLDLKYADAFIGVANAAVIDVLDTTNGAASEDTDANINGGAAVANGKVVYLEFGTAYTETSHQVIFEMWFHNEED